MPAEVILAVNIPVEATVLGAAASLISTVSPAFAVAPGSQLISNTLYAS